MSDNQQFKRRKKDSGSSDDDLNLSTYEIQMSPVASLSSESSVECQGVTDTSSECEEELGDESHISEVDHNGEEMDVTCLDISVGSITQNIGGSRNTDILQTSVAETSIIDDISDYSSDSSSVDSDIDSEVGADGVMPNKYLEHHVDLISCLHILQSSSISPEDLLTSDKKLKNYVKNFEVLYGTRYMSMVIHLLQHLVFVVNNLGPMRYVSCFPYESLNGEILKMIHGTRYVETQIASGCFLINQLPKSIQSLSSKCVKNYCEKLQHPSLRLKKLENIDIDMFSVGTYQPLSSKKQFVYDVLLKHGLCKEGTTIQSFLRLKKRKLLFVSRSYSRTVKKNSYTCTFMSNETEVGHGAIDLFVKAFSKFHCDQSDVRFFAIIQVAEIEPYVIGSKQVPHISRYSLTKEYVAIPLSQLRDMLVCVDVDDSSFVCKPIY